MIKTKMNEKTQIEIYFLLFPSAGHEVIERLDEGLVLAGLVVLRWMPINCAEAS